MSGLTEQLDSVLKDPQMMQKLMAAAQSLSGTQEGRDDPGGSAPAAGLPDLGQLMAGSGCLDPDQENLLNALCPYLSQDRLRKLERAMRASRLAEAAGSFLNSDALQLLVRR